VAGAVVVNLCYSRQQTTNKRLPSDICETAVKNGNFNKQLIINDKIGAFCMLLVKTCGYLLVGSNYIDPKNLNMKLIIFCFCVSTITMLSSCTSKQVREEKYDDGTPSEKFQVIEKKDGSFIKDGYYKKWHTNGQISVAGIYKNNLETGTWTYYFSTGNKEEFGDFTNGKKQGEWRSYSENGQILSKENYLNGELDGLQTY
jgi:antitoxin component YwqK of YwqJK toxin-antitoxin module